MDCKDAQREISLYLEGKLNGKKELRFLDHVENCPECMEELSIQYLIKEGTARLEDGSSFDLNRELKDKIQHSRKEISRQTKWNIVLYVWETIAILAVVFILILLVMSK